MFVVLTAGCVSKDCYDNQTTLPRAAFFSMQTHSSVSIDSLSIRGIGAPGDSLLVDTTMAEQTNLPLRYDASSTAFLFDYLQAGAPAPDSVTFYYKAQPWFVSEACGVVYYYHIDSIKYTHNFIDSVAVPGMLITNADRTNIEIYFKDI